jgi:hypothetical protein
VKAWLTRAGPLVGAIGLVARSALRELVIATLLDLVAGRGTDPFPFLPPLTDSLST